ncbi:hypothetical protein [Desulfococcus sp.]|uniref:hypothetical protein n=1 Tax=Desulfococcus sp. TaxID=2025834 RepID=UPI00359348B7
MANKIIWSIREVSIIILVNLFGVLILFLLFEGMTSILLLVRSARHQGLVSERKHTQYDSEIGWINLPNLNIRNMYRGKTFITNSMSFRNDKEFGVDVPDKKVRVICSGDSFTMGYGVGNEEVWCSLLESMNNRIESVNLGQGGYGFDQAYLWYKRNSPKLGHDVHLFAFITPDFTRMQSGTFLGYGKPLLVLKDNRLVNVNDPVPKQSYLFPRLPLYLQELSQLNSIKMIGILKKKLFKKDASLELGKQDQKDRETQAVVEKIIEDLQRINKDKNSILVLVHLPTVTDYKDKHSEKWRQFLHAESEKRGFVLIDLIEEIRKYSTQEVGQLFDGHYSEKGNAYIARKLYEKMQLVPEIAERFQRL